MYPAVAAAHGDAGDAAWKWLRSQRRGATRCGGVQHRQRYSAEGLQGGAVHDGQVALAEGGHHLRGHTHTPACL